jgi:RNA polymerase sigma factor (sigma-70 family)
MRMAERSVPAGSATEADVVGEAAASFEAFYEATYRRLFTALALVTRDRFEAEEIAQDAFLRVYERWDRVSSLEDPTGYLFRVALNVFRSRYRRAVLGLRRVAALAPEQRDDLAKVESHDEVVHLLAGLEPRERAAVVLTAILDHSAEEAGRLLGMRASSVRSLTARARARMKHGVGERP